MTVFVMLSMEKSNDMSAQMFLNEDYNRFVGSVYYKLYCFRTAQIEVIQWILLVYLQILYTKYV